MKPTTVITSLLTFVAATLVYMLVQAGGSDRAAAETQSPQQVKSQAKAPTSSPVVPPPATSNALRFAVLRQPSPSASSTSKTPKGPPRRPIRKRGESDYQVPARWVRSTTSTTHPLRVVQEDRASRSRPLRRLKDEIAKGTLAFFPINLDEVGNDHFRRTTSYTPSVIVATSATASRRAGRINEGVGASHDPRPSQSYMSIRS